jgi:hypothetical protein
MPVLPNHVPQLKQFYLPSTAALPPSEQAWVKIDLSPATTADLLLYEDTDNADVRFIKWLVSRAHSWNFNEPDGKPIDINFQSVLRIDKQDYHYLFQEHIKSISESMKADPGLSTEEKKSSSAI